MKYRIVLPHTDQRIFQQGVDMVLYEFPEKHRAFEVLYSNNAAIVKVNPSTQIEVLEYLETTKGYADGRKAINHKIKMPSGESGHIMLDANAIRFELIK